MPDDYNNLIVHRGEENFVILNKYPYTSGHMMVVPMMHTCHMEDLSTAPNRDDAARAPGNGNFRTCLSSPGFQRRAEHRRAGGAGIAEHLHLHVVPRWQRDTNFITVLGQARVLPESLEDSYNQIKKAWK